MNTDWRIVDDPRMTWGLSEADVNLTMYGGNIVQSGFKVVLSIVIVQDKDFTDYALEIENLVGKTVIKFKLKREGNVIDSLYYIYIIPLN